jgi:dTMP kinase
MTAGRLIVIEGIDGAGTTTQTRLLCQWMRASGHEALATREPSDGPIGRLLRDILRGAHQPVSGTTMALLFAADRMDHLAREIEPALARGVHVVSDRYYHSSLAYQSLESDREFVEHLNQRARVPDLTLLLAVSPAQAAARRRAEGREDERYDATAVQEQVARNYERVAAERGAREPIVIVPGDPDIAAVQARLRAEVSKLCG